MEAKNYSSTKIFLSLILVAILSSTNSTNILPQSHSNSVDPNAPNSSSFYINGNLLPSDEITDYLLFPYSESTNTNLSGVINACEINCPVNIVVNLLPGACATEINYSVTTNCPGNIQQVSGLPSGSEFPIGTTTNIFNVVSGSNVIASCGFEVTVNEYSGPVLTALACNSLAHISVDHDCQVIINADVILEGGPYRCYDDYIVNLDQYGSTNINNVPISPSLGLHSITVIDPETGNSCFGDVLIEDKILPDIICPVDFTIYCVLAPPIFTGFASGTDNCSTPTITYFDVDHDGSCPGQLPGIIRTWIATDAAGNSSTCTQYISKKCQASYIAFTDIFADHVTVDWENGNGTRRIVKINTSNSFTSPLDGTDPDAYPIYSGSGEQVVYNGSSNFVTVSGLSPNTTYWFRVFEAYCDGLNSIYNPDHAQLNPRIFVTNGDQSASSTIEIYASHINNPNLGSDVLMGSALTSDISPTAVRICADGSNATLIKYVNNDINISTSSIKFNISSDPIGHNIDKYGTFNSSDYFYIDNTVYARFTHPSYTSPTHFNLFSYDSIQVVVNNNNIIYKYPILIVRAPVLFVHGLWGNQQTFEEMQQSFIINNLYPIIPIIYDNSPLLLRADYSFYNASSFESNRKFLPFYIDILLKQAKISEYIAGRVIVIAHSMGGLLSRLYLQGSYSDIAPYRNDIIKLITLNTPHYGTQMANYLYEINPDLIPLINLWLSNPPNNGNTDAIRDLCVDSDPVTDLINIPPISQNKVASSTIHSDAVGDNSIEAWIIRLYFLSFTLNKLFDYDINDLIVPKRSQNAHLNVFNTTPKQFHLGSSRNIIHIMNCINLIDENPNQSNRFVNSGFPVDIIPPPLISAKPELSLSRSTFNNLKFLSPDNGAIFSAGDVFNVTLDINSNITRLALIASGNSIEPILVDSLESSSIEIQIPFTAVGRINIIALGGDSTEWKDFASIHIMVTNNLSPDSIRVSNRILSVPLGVHRMLIPYGYFSDLKIDLSSAVDITVEYDSTFINYDNRGYIQGIDTGTTSIKYIYNGHEDSCLVHIYDEPSILTSAFTYSSNHVCQGESISYSQRSIGKSVKYEWVFHGGTPSSSTLAEPLIAYYSPGIYAVELKTTFVNGVDSFFRDSLIVVHDVPIVIVDSSNSTTFCQGDSVVLSSSPGLQYIWNTGHDSQEITVLESGDFYVMVTDENGCSSTSEIVTVSVNIATIPKISSIDDKFALCQGDSITLIVDPAFHYSWNTGDTTRSINIKVGGEFFVTITDINGCTAVSEPIYINELNSPSIDLGFDSLIVNKPHVLDAGNPGSQYEWNTSDTTQTILVISTGHYSVTVTDTNGCTAQDDIYVDFTTSVINVSDTEKILLYPNPSTGVINIIIDVIDVEGQRLLNINAYSITGEEVYAAEPEIITERFLSTVDLSDRQPGTYVVRISLGDKVYFSNIVLTK